MAGTRSEGTDITAAEGFPPAAPGGTMPKTYQAPDPEHPQGEPHQRKKVGVYDRPEGTGRPRGITLAIAVMVAILIILLLYMLFGGEDVQGAVTQLYFAGIETYRTM